MTTMLAEHNEEFAPEELAESGSFNHSYLQTKLAVLLFSLDDYMAFTSYSVDDVVDDTMGIRLPLSEIFS